MLADPQISTSATKAMRPDSVFPSVRGSNRFAAAEFIWLRSDRTLTISEPAYGTSTPRAIYGSERLIAVCLFSLYCSAKILIASALLSILSKTNGIFDGRWH